MRLRQTDPLWPELEALWADLGALTPRVLLSGGYGLFLKQRFLSANPSVATIVSAQTWGSRAPRSTKDVDFLVHVELIAHLETQGAIRQALKARGFQPVKTETLNNENWQFHKPTLTQGQGGAVEDEVVVDLLAPSPGDVAGLKSDRIRVASKKSLGDEGVHGRHTPEALGCDLHPFPFTWQGLNLYVPNPVSWSMMKLFAMRDRWQNSQNDQLTPEQRADAREKAIKHAGDVCRVVAFTTIFERNQAPGVVSQIRGQEVKLYRRDKSSETVVAFDEARTIAHQFFVDEGAMMTLEPEVAGQWNNDFELIRNVLGQWF